MVQTPLREMQSSTATVARNEAQIQSVASRALWWRAVRAVFVKDWRGEWRTRAALNSIALFAIAVPISLSFSVAAQKLKPDVQAGLLWTTLLLAALIGLSRVWIKEEESGTHWLLRLHAPASAVLWGKTLWNFSLLLLTQIGAVPVTIVLLDIHVAQPGLLIGVLLLSDIGLAAVSSLLGAMTMGAQSRGALFCAIAIPILLPLLVIATNATGVAFGNGGDAQSTLQALVAYDVAMLAAAWMLFDFVWN